MANSDSARTRKKLIAPKGWRCQRARRIRSPRFYQSQPTLKVSLPVDATHLSRCRSIIIIASGQIGRCDDFYAQTMLNPSRPIGCNSKLVGKEHSGVSQLSWSRELEADRWIFLDIGCYTGLSALAWYEGTRSTGAKFMVVVGRTMRARAHRRSRFSLSSTMLNLPRPLDPRSPSMVWWPYWSAGRWSEGSVSILSLVDPVAQNVCIHAYKNSLADCSRLKSHLISSLLILTLQPTDRL